MKSFLILSITIIGFNLSHAKSFADFKHIECNTRGAGIDFDVHFSPNKNCSKKSCSGSYKLLIKDDVSIWEPGSISSQNTELRTETGYFTNDGTNLYFYKSSFSLKSRGSMRFDSEEDISLVKHSKATNVDSYSSYFFGFYYAGGVKEVTNNPMSCYYRDEANYDLHDVTRLTFKSARLLNGAPNPHRK